MRKRLFLGVLGVLTAVAGWGVTGLVLPAASGQHLGNVQIASADACYTWPRTLRRGMSGDDVRQLQIRVAGWAAYHDYVAIDGAFGPETEAAVRRFQAGYGLQVDGIAGPQTFGKIYELQDSDCTPVHFAYSEFDDECFGGFSGGKVSASTVRSNLLRVMWKLEALRKKLDMGPLYIASGFRSVECNRRAGGAADSQHLYGTAADVVPSSPTRARLCTVASAARYAGFQGIIAPGSPDGNHEDHVHVDNRVENTADGPADSYYWSTTCF